MDNKRLFLTISRGPTPDKGRAALVSADEELIGDVLNFIAGALSGLGTAWPVTDADRAEVAKVLRVVRDGHPAGIP